MCAVLINVCVCCMGACGICVLEPCACALVCGVCVGVWGCVVVVQSYNRRVVCACALVCGVQFMCVECSCILIWSHLCRGRGRYVNEEFDLDLTYITERIIGNWG